MENNDHLFNAAMVGENPSASFIIEGKRLHAVDLRVAKLEKEKCNPKQIVAMLRDGLKALVKYSTGKVEGHFIDVDWRSLEKEPNERLALINKTHEIFSHLPHQCRNELSSMIHHKQSSR